MARSAAGLAASAGNNFNASAPAANMANASAGVKKPGMASSPCCFAARTIARVRVGGDDDPAASGGYVRHLPFGHHGTGTNQQPVA